DQLDDVSHHANEPIIVVADPPQELDLVLCHELESIEVVPELVELTQRDFEGPVIRYEQRRRHRVELGRRIVLNLSIRGNLALQLDQVLGTTVASNQHLKRDASDRHQ